MSFSKDKSQMNTTNTGRIHHRTTMQNSVLPSNNNNSNIYISANNHLPGHRRAKSAGHPSAFNNASNNYRDNSNYHHYRDHYIATGLYAHQPQHQHHHHHHHLSGECLVDTTTMASAVASQLWTMAPIVKRTTSEKTLRGGYCTVPDCPHNNNHHQSFPLPPQPPPPYSYDSSTSKTIKTTASSATLPSATQSTAESSSSYPHNLNNYYPPSRHHHHIHHHHLHHHHSTYQHRHHHPSVTSPPPTSASKRNKKRHSSSTVRYSTLRNTSSDNSDAIINEEEENDDFDDDDYDQDYQDQNHIVEYDDDEQFVIGKDEQCACWSMKLPVLQHFARIQIFVFLCCILVTLQQALSSGYFNRLILTFF